MADATPDWKEFLYADYTDKNRLSDFLEKKEIAEAALKRAYEDRGCTEMQEVYYSIDWIPTKQAFLHVFKTNMR